MAVMLFAVGYALLPLYPHRPLGDEYFLLDHSLPTIADTAKRLPMRFVFKEQSHHVVRLDQHQPLQYLAVGQPVYSFITLTNTSTQTVSFELNSRIWPGVANLYLNKLTCACFQRLQLDPKASMQVPISFVLSQGMPARVEQVELQFSVQHLSFTEASDT